MPKKPTNERLLALDRRDFLRLSGTGAAVVAAGTAGAMVASAPALAGPASQAASLPKASGPRCVVVGGGWSGLTMAKYLKKENPKFDVVLVEPNSMFMSCPLSNLWLGGVLNMETLLHSYVDAAKNNHYVYLQATLVDLDRSKKRAVTNRGYIDYSHIVLAPGIDYNYTSIGVTDPADIATLSQNYPAAFKPGSETLSLKKKIDNFEGGTFLLTVPSGNYRCLPGPYERACMIAAVFKKNKVKGKVILIDPSDKPGVKDEGFLAAFKDLYRDHLEYRTSTKVEGVDVGKKVVKTDFGDIKFDDASIYPSVRGATILEELGLSVKDGQMEGNIDPLTYNLKGDNNCYITGDARSLPFSKSGNTANSEAHYVAKLIAARTAGKKIEWTSPHTICYSMVNANPQESIMIDASYKHDGKGAGWEFTDVKVDNKRSAANGAANLVWGEGLYNDMFEA
jgi:NADPH-dependent 2,4-dienoyl-CoA reductase/sulfur reductase-like enzyme